MTYRRERRKSQYLEMNFDLPTAAILDKFMKKNNMTRPVEVWIHNIKTILENDPKELLTNEQINIFVCIKNEFRTHSSTFLTIWEIDNDNNNLEYILNENCFGIVEGNFPILSYHSFFPITPKLVMVLCDKFLRQQEFGCNNIYREVLNARESLFGTYLNVGPEIKYVKSSISCIADIDDINDLDEFTYTRIRIRDNDVKMVNSLFLNETSDYILYAANISLLKSIRFYNKNKDIFSNKVNYSELEKYLIKTIKCY